jgi:hypothetical protein
MKSFLTSFFRLFDASPISRDGFPKLIRNHWYCGAWYLHKGEEGVPVFNPFRTGLVRDDTADLIDDLIPAYRIAGKIGLYKQVGEKYPYGCGGSDLAPWDDGKAIDLRFVRSIIAPLPQNTAQSSIRETGAVT